MTTVQEISLLTRKLESLKKAQSKLTPKWNELAEQITDIQRKIGTKLGVPMVPQFASDKGWDNTKGTLKQQTLNALTDTPKHYLELCAETGGEYATIAALLHNATKNGEAKKVGRGLFVKA